MKKNVRMVLICAVLLLFYVSAHAENGVYMSANLGAAMLSDADATYPGFDSAISLLENYYSHFDIEYKHAIEFDAGQTFSLAVGAASGKRGRFEAEFIYQKNEVDSASFVYSEDIDVTVDGEPFVSDYTWRYEDIISGDISRFTFMVNGYFDFKNASAFTPFLGIGVGYAKIEYDISSLFVEYFTFKYDDDYNVTMLKQSGSAGVLAYQLSAGVGYAMSNHLTLDFRYRYFASEDPEFEDMTIQYKTHNLTLGARYVF